MTTLVLVNTVTIVQNSQPSKVFAGESISDAGIQASVLAAGGVLAPATDPNLVAAAALVAKARSHGANEAECTTIMMAAYASTAYGVAIQEAVYTLTAAEVVALGAVLTGTLPFAAALPTGARYVGAEVNVTTAAAGVTTLLAELGDGTTAAEYLADTVNLKATGKSAPAGSATVMQSAGGVTPTLTITSTGTDLNTVTGLVATVKLFYTVLP
jgi:hypothetical protein